MHHLKTAFTIQASLAIALLAFLLGLGIWLIFNNSAFSNKAIIETSPNVIATSPSTS